MRQDLIKIIEEVKERITDNSDIVWTGYDSAKKLRTELEIYIEQLKSGDLTSLSELHKHFLPTCTFQEHSISNGWADEYIRLSEKFDTFYETLKNHS